MPRSRRRARSDEPALAAVYEGPEALTALLALAGSPHTAEEVAAAFARAQRDGESRSDVIPALFPQEPRFASPADARRLYGNLFGLWKRVASGRGVADDAPSVAVERPEPTPAPARGSLPGQALPADFVEAMWKHMATLPEREARRLRDRFPSAQPDLAAWLDQVRLPDSGALAAMDLAFEAWAMLDQGFAGRLRAVGWKEIEALETEPPPLESVQPAFAAYAAEQLDNLADDDRELDEEARAQVERVVAAAATALTRAVGPPQQPS